jgi:hypothetical protein
VLREKVNGLIGRKNPSLTPAPDLGTFESDDRNGDSPLVELALNVAAFLFLAFVGLVGVAVILSIVGMIVFYPFAKLYDVLESFRLSLRGLDDRGMKQWDQSSLSYRLGLAVGILLRRLRRVSWRTR